MIPHVGGPIAGPGAPTVLIGGLPTAKVGDPLIAVGPPHVIVQGSATIRIASLPAAHIGDITNSSDPFGVLISGSPVVIGGYTTAATSRK